MSENQFNQIYILINIAGIWLINPFLRENDTEASNVWQLNYWVPYYFMKQTIPYMLTKGGGIINIASTAGIKGTGQEATYGASKAALINLSESIAEEFAPRNIRVNCISPGPTNTSSISKYYNEPMKELLVKHIPMNRLDDVPSVVGG